MHFHIAKPSSKSDMFLTVFQLHQTLITQIWAEGKLDLGQCYFNLLHLYCVSQLILSKTKFPISWECGNENRLYLVQFDKSHFGWITPAYIRLTNSCGKHHPQTPFHIGKYEVCRDIPYFFVFSFAQNKKYGCLLEPPY